MKITGQIFTRLTALMHCGTEMNSSDWWSQQVKVQDDIGIKHAGHSTLRPEAYNTQSSVAFYRSMQFNAKHGLAIACHPSVRLSVCDVGDL